MFQVKDNVLIFNGIPYIMIPESHIVGIVKLYPNHIKIIERNKINHHNCTIRTDKLIDLLLKNE